MINAERFYAKVRVYLGVFAVLVRVSSLFCCCAMYND